MSEWEEGWKRLGQRAAGGSEQNADGHDQARRGARKCGEVTDVHVVTDRDSGQSRGFAFVTMGNAQQAAAAIAAMNGALLDGRQLRVNEAEERPRGGGGGGGGGYGGGGDGGGGGRGGGGGGRGRY